MTLVEERPITANSEHHKALMRFCQLTGYSANDILSLSYETNTFLVRNGGKYKLVNGKIEHLAGPSPDPNERM